MPATRGLFPKMGMYFIPIPTGIKFQERMCFIQPHLSEVVQIRIVLPYLLRQSVETHLILFMKPVCILFVVHGFPLVSQIQTYASELFHVSVVNMHGWHVVH